MLHYFRKWVNEISIYLYSGTPGSGKSLHMASEIISKLNYGYKVIGTMKINENALRKKHEKYTYISIYDLDPKNLLKYSKRYFRNHKFRNKEDRILLVIDECQRIFNPRNWQDKNRNDWITFFAEHRHFGYKIILVAQMDRMLDRQIRGLIEYEYIHRKLGNFGLQGKIFNLLTMGQTFVAVKVWYPIKEKETSEFFRGSKRLYSLYDSYEIFD